MLDVPKTQDKGETRRMLKSKVVFSLIHLLAAALLAGVANPLSRNDFPPHFLFGASSSAYQVEDAADEDGRKPSIWDTFVHAGNNAKIHRRDGYIGCDQYHKYKGDVKLMVKMGLDAYRFSISWSRLIPDGKGPINPKGLQYYNNLINELTSQGIQPHVTLHHFDLPQALEDEYGGWVSRRVVKDFKAYADVCFREFGDRVKYWTTVNEGNVFAFGGYDIGLIPPQRCSPSIGNCSRGNSSIEPYLAGHHILLAHASTARLYRKKYQDKQHGFVGANLLAFGFVPLTNTSEDINAARRAQDFFMGWFLNPLICGEYPGIMKKNAGSRLPVFTKRESSLVKGSMDFLGINFYYTYLVKNSPSSLHLEDTSFTADMAAELELLTKNGTSTYELPITPWILKEILESLKKDYGNFPIYIHENGQQTQRNSSLDDWQRVKYLHEYISSLLDILRDGVNLRGYFVWSFLDMLEVLTGYESSYGLYYIDLKDPTLRRQPKLSSVWYSNFLHNNGSMDSKVITTTDIEKNVSVLSNTPLLHSAI